MHAMQWSASRNDSDILINYKYHFYFLSHIVWVKPNIPRDLCTLLLKSEGNTVENTVQIQKPFHQPTLNFGCFSVVVFFFFWSVVNNDLFYALNFWGFGANVFWFENRAMLLTAVNKVHSIRENLQLGMNWQQWRQ